MWYEEQRPGLGDEFVASVSSVLERITEVPFSFPGWPELPAGHSPIHRAVTPRFPYLIAFEVHSQHVLVLAIAHAKRRPFYWLTRTR
ncbi:Hypothetical protein CAP_5754 [Chondromyces apiculatus DSM 436]|uniref:Plasmid stabilization system protein n=1 Tax=Chondromyces apiculatus DSM 436 TaxID=1192034 RepID=A0A017T322_9BACT|nr:Hypothetical protein CAP_5754 [Chondromyces apiculatus DSM 436]